MNNWLKNLMKIAFISRSTLFKVPGGDTEQIVQTARCLENIGAETDICLAHQEIDYKKYDLLHFFNLIRPSDILYHVTKSNKPFVISPNLVDYSEYDRRHRGGIGGLLFRLFSGDTNEYLKTILRWLMKRDVLRTKSYITLGHKRSIREILKKSSIVLPNSESEHAHLTRVYSVDRPFCVVPNGVNTEVFIPKAASMRDDRLVVCAGRIEGLKNQLNLIRALNNTRFTLVIAGEPAPNQQEYYRKCRRIAADNIIFTGRLSQNELVAMYGKAKVHALPSWFETCGLSTLEAAAMGCNVVITDKGYTREYFADDAFYCDPSDQLSILAAVEDASRNNVRKKLQGKVLRDYTWQRAAVATLEAYTQIISSQK